MTYDPGDPVYDPRHRHPEGALGHNYDEWLIAREEESERLHLEAVAEARAHETPCDICDGTTADHYYGCSEGPDFTSASHYDPADYQELNGWN